MLARLQALIVLSLLCAVAGWILIVSIAGYPTWAAAGVAALASGYALFMACEFAMMRAVQRGEGGPAPRAGQVVRAWWSEVLAAPGVFLWRQPFRSRAVPDFVPGLAMGRVGVVLVHGFFCNRGLWNPWLRTLRDRGTPCAAVNLEPIFGSIDRYAPIIDAAVAHMEAATGRPVVLVGHSMGGLAIRAWMAQSPAHEGHILRVLTIGTPHRGTWLARFATAENMRQLRLDSSWLRDLAAREPSARYDKFTCYFSDCDNIVFPLSAAVLPGAENVLVPGMAHVHLAFSPAVFAGLLRWLD